MDSSTKLLFLSASAGKVSRSEMLVDVIGEMLSDTYTQLGHVRVREVPPASLLTGNMEDAQLAQAVRAVEDAQVIIVVTPIYKGSYTGLLKAFLDILPQYAMRGKCIFPLTVGGSLAHMQMLDFSLRPVLQTMWPAHIGQGSFVLDQNIIVEDGRAHLAESAQPILREAIESFEQLVRKYLV